MTDCKAIQDRLPDFLEGKLAAPERPALEEHLLVCAGCAEMVELLRLEPTHGGEAPDLAALIFTRTSGSPCGRAFEILGDHVDGTLGELDTHLIERHMSGCDDCVRLATTLARLSEDLSVMALLRPAGDFVGEVLRATLPRPSVGSTLAARCARLWDAFADRPRLAWEAGYVGAMALWLVWGAFGAPINASQVPDSAEQAALVRDVGARIAGFGEQAWLYTSEKSLSTLDGLQDDLSERIGPTRENLGERIERLGAASAFDALNRHARTVWQRFVPEKTQYDETGTDTTSDPQRSNR